MRGGGRRASDMNRRQFLARLGLGAAAVAATAVLDPERLLWVPGQKTIFDLGATPAVDEPFVYLAEDVPFEQYRNTFIAPEWFTREALKVLNHSFKLMGQINRSYDDAFQVGEIVKIRHTPLFERAALIGESI